MKTTQTAPVPSILHGLEDERSLMQQILTWKSATFSRSGTAAQLIIVGEQVPNFRQEIRQSHYRNDPVKYDLDDASSQCV